VNAEATISVDVAWSPAPREMRSATLRLPSGSTIAHALRATGWAELVQAAEGDAALAAAGLAVAVWAHSRALATPLRDGDRVEVLRALTIAPMDARRARYEAAGGAQALRRRKYQAQLKR
jgi:putative ubiquitin-RnfH superfamily antitoxin RatB of RatAB toxin-antitoxin module